MSEAAQDEGKEALGVIARAVDNALAMTFPHLDFAITFWDRGAEEDRLRNVIFARPERFDEALVAMETAIRATREAASGLTLRGNA